MGLNRALATLAVRHSHALVVEAPGAWRTRSAAESAVLGRGWRLAVSPADADILVVCGTPGPQLAAAVDVVWHQLPGPRIRVDLDRSDDVEAGLDRAQAQMLDTDLHRHDARQRPDAFTLLAERPGDEGHAEHEGMDHGGGHEGMDHGDMEMSPGGIALAEGGEDRDGLEMDVLKVRLGPVLPHWPAGLVLHCSLQGDVIVEARAQLLDGSGQEREALGRPRRLDNLASLLAVAGWDDAAAEARRLRDIALQGDDGPAGPAVERLARKLRRSRMLRWSLRGIRPLSEGEAEAYGLPADLAGDTHDRLIRMLDRAEACVSSSVAAQSGTGTRPGSRTLSTDLLAPLVSGLDLATARLVVASLDVDELLVGQAEHEVSDG